MGWTSFHRPASQSVKDTIIKEVTGNTGEVRYEVVDIHVGRTVAYVALKRTPICPKFREVCIERETSYVLGEDGSYTYGLIVLHSTGNGQRENFSYKDMSETMGPYYYGAPARILNALSPLREGEHNDFARKWREQCRENLKVAPVKAKAKKALKDGDIIRFENIINFAKGMGMYDTFEVMKVGRALRFYALGVNGARRFLCSISRFNDRPFTAMTHAEAFPALKEAA